MLFSVVLEGDLGGFFAFVFFLGRGLRCVWFGIRVLGYGLKSFGCLFYYVCKGVEELDFYGIFLIKLNKDFWKDCKFFDCWVFLVF